MIHSKSSWNLKVLMRKKTSKEQIYIVYCRRNTQLVVSEIGSGYINNTALAGIIGGRCRGGFRFKIRRVPVVIIRTDSMKYRMWCIFLMFQVSYVMGLVYGHELCKSWSFDGDKP